MSSIAQKFAAIPGGGTKAASLPVSNNSEKHELGGGLRRRLSSMSLKIQGNPVLSSSSSWLYSSSSSLFRGRSTKSLSFSSMGDGMISIREWWDWSLAWILSRKPIFAADLEMNEHETKVLGSHNRGSWRHLFFKLRSQIRRITASDHASLPQTYRYHQ